MQWPVYSLAEAGAEIIRTYYNGVPDPFNPSNSSGGNDNSNKNNTSSNDPKKGGASSFSAPSILTSVLALLFGAFVVAL